MWQNFGTVLDGMSMFKSLTGKKTDEIDPPLLRLPHPKMPWKMGMRVFVDQYLPKINDWLHETPQQNHHKLLAKLKNSKYTTLELKIGGDSSLQEAMRSYYKDRKIVGFSTRQYSIRNYDTDWNVVKGPSRIRRA
jgi:hypothetical protein